MSASLLLPKVGSNVYNWSMNTKQSTKLSAIKSWLGTGSINIFGRQYSGKDTQCVRLAHDLDGIVIGGGDILRSGNTPKYVMEQVNSGDFSPTDEYRAIVTPYLAKPEFSDKPLLLSTVGRMKGEEAVILEAAKKSGHEIKAVVFLDIDESVTWERFERGREDGTRELRADDDKAAIEKRLKLFNENTVQVIDIYRTLGLVIDIDGSADEDTVYSNIVSRLYEKATL